MRFIAKYANFNHGVRAGRFMVLADGQRQEMVSDLFARFESGVLTEDEIQFGIKNLTHNGLPIDKNTEQHFSPRSRISGFDSVLTAKASGWTDEERELVDRTLLSSTSYGTDFIKANEALLVMPWSTYDESPGEKVISLARDLGIALSDVLAYEKANRNDAGLVYLLEREIASGVVEEEEAPVVIEA